MYSALYVDDDPSFLEICKMFLERTGFIRVTTALSAKEAVNTYHSQAFDIIIADYKLPVMDGLRLLKEIRKEDPTIPFIIFTGRGREDVAIEALNSGASFYLQKGGDVQTQFAELTHMIQQAITYRKAEVELKQANEQMKSALLEINKKNEELISINEELTSTEEELNQTIYEMKKQADIITESEERYRLVMEATSDGIWDWDLITDKTYFSDWYYRMIGYEPGEFEGNYENWRKLVHPDDLSYTELQIKQSLSDHQSGFDVEFRIRTKEGDYRWIHGRGKVVAWDASGNPVRMVGSHIDITDKKKVEQALLESQEKYRILAENIKDTIFMMRIPDGYYDYISPAIQALTGYSADEFYRSPELLRKCIRSAFQDYFITKWEELKQGIVDDEYEFQIVTRDGQIKWVNQRNNAVRDENGQLIALQGVVTDITERKNSEEIVHEAMRKYEILFESVPSGIIVTDEDGEIIELNEYAAHILNIAREEILTLGMQNQDWGYYQSDGTTFPLELSSSPSLLSLGSDAQGIEIGIRNPKGDLIWVMATSAGIGLEGLGYIVSFLDMSEKRRVNQALSMVNKKLSLLTSITRHDIRNSLTALKGFLYILSDEPANDMQKDMIARINTITRDIGRKIEFTSTYQKIGAENPEWQDVASLINDLSPTGLTITNELDGLEIFADQMLGMVFENLVQNSQMHGETVSKISIQYKTEGHDLNLIYEDNGAGIPDSEKEVIFDRGYGKNTGFGLFLIREILSITGISIRENGIPGKGACFEMIVPQGSYRFSRS